MNIVAITTELNKCLKCTHTEDDLIKCVDYAFEKSELDTNSVVTILPQEDALLFKKIMYRIIVEKQFSLNYVFKKMWWNNNKEINVIAAYFIPDVFGNTNEIDWIFFRQVLDRLKSWDITTIISSVMENLILNNIENWERYFIEIVKLNNKWALRLAALVLGKIALTHTHLIPSFMKIIMLIKRSRDWEVQQAIGWCLNNMAGAANEPIYELESLNTINLKRMFSLN